MKVQIFDTYDDLSEKAARDFIRLLESIEEPLVCVASGDSPSGLYKILVQKINDKQVDISNWNFVGLDEWMGMNGADDGSCRFHLNRQLFNRLPVKKERICFFDGRTTDPEEECHRIENFIQQHGGIDVAIVGLGMNGHIGMNEPGTSSTIRSHLTEIDPLTQQVGQKYFSKAKELSQGLTLGIQTLVEAKQIILIVNGAHKASIVQKILEEENSEQLPATLLRDHPALTIYLDKPAAQYVTLYE